MCDAFIEVLSTLEIKFTQTCKGLAPAAAVSLCILSSVPYTNAELAQTHSGILIGQPHFIGETKSKYIQLKKAIKNLFNMACHIYITNLS